MSKDMIYNDLMDMMSDDECPICRLIAHRTNKRISHVLTGCVTNPDSRERFLDAEGFCKHHGDQVLRKGRPLSHAILYESLIEEKKKSLDKKRSPKTCELCELEHKNEKNYLHYFPRLLKEEAFFKRYEEEGMLCMHHLEACLASMRKKSALRERLKHTTLTKYDTLQSHLREIRRKRDYKAAHEKWTEEERRAWKKAVRMTTDQGDYRR